MSTRANTTRSGESSESALSGFTIGSVTGVIDRLEQGGYREGELQVIADFRERVVEQPGTDRPG